MANLKSRVMVYLIALCALLLLGVACVVGWVAKSIVRPSPSELKARTVSRDFQPWKKGEVASLVIEKAKRDIYEVGFEFPTQKLKRGQSFEGLLRIEVFEDGKSVVARDISGKKRAYFADTRSYRSIALAYFELPVVQGAKEDKLVVTVVSEDAALVDFQDLKLFVRPSPVK